MFHVLVDLETMGVHSYAPIVSIGAVKFDPTNCEQTDDTFYSVVSLESSMEFPECYAESQTILWWLQQNEEARQQLVDVRAVHLRDALTDFAVWYKGSTGLWGNGANFDPVILANAYKVVGMVEPFNNSDVRCVRTALSLAGIHKRDGYVKHHALYDASAHLADLKQALHTIRGNHG